MNDSLSLGLSKISRYCTTLVRCSEKQKRKKFEKYLALIRLIPDYIAARRRVEVDWEVARERGNGTAVQKKKKKKKGTVKSRLNLTE